MAVVDQKELGRRIKCARESSSLTRDNVARRLGISRSAVARIENGDRAVTSIELARLAYLFCRDIRSFVAEDAFSGEDMLAALFRIHPELPEREDVLESLRRCAALGREAAGLDQLLDLNRDCVPAYSMPMPRSKRDAVRQGERVASEERSRLGLGLSPLPDIADLLETQGIRTARITIPDDISGLTLIDTDIVFLVAVNRKHKALSARFSYAHEYGHVLMDDRSRGAHISRDEDRDDLLEVRADSFASRFLMPADAVRRFVSALGKGQEERTDIGAYDAAAARPRTYSACGSQKIQIYEAVQVAHHFGVSLEAACRGLRDAHLLTDAELQDLLDQDRAGCGEKTERFLGLPGTDSKIHRNGLHHRFLGLGLEALRREAISRAKFIETASMAEASAEEAGRLVSVLGLEDDRGAGVSIPGG